MLHEKILKAYAPNNRRMSFVREIISGRTSYKSWHGNCVNPLEIVVWGTRQKDMAGNDLHQQVTTVRCRKCDGCRRHRVAQIVSRCGEMACRASRTKFVTLTVDDRFKEQNHSTDFFVCEMQRYIKRVRAVAPPFVYAWVVEFQPCGAPHAHIIVFEGHNGEVTNAHIKGRTIKSTNCWKARWPWGFLHTKIANNNSKAAWYLVKYITKDPATRFRRSIGLQPTSPKGSSL